MVTEQTAGPAASGGPETSEHGETPAPSVEASQERVEASVPIKVTDGIENEPSGPPSEPAAAAPEAAEVTCPSCGEHAVPGARFCEGCGASLDPAPPTPEEPAAPATAAGPTSRPCVRCGGVVAADGYCEACGAPAASERDHFAVTVSPTVGGVCDRGVVHRRNEDAMALAVAQGVAVLVVCDGVSTAPSSDVASMAASGAARDLLVTGAPGGEREVGGIGAARTSGWASLLIDAARAANDAVLTVPTIEGEAPSCTYVAAVVDGPLVVLACVGDSRAYWLPDAGPASRLTVDDSWAQEMLEMGMPPAQVDASPHAHAITRWLGADAPELSPRTDTMTVTGPGWLLLCSDGLWNYCGDAEELRDLTHATATSLGTDGADPTELAGALVTWANAQGGRDNVTVALARLGAAQSVTPGDRETDNLPTR